MFTIGLSYNIPTDKFNKELEGFKIIKPKEYCKPFTIEEVESFIEECDAFITMLDFPFREEMFNKAKNLKVIGNLGSG
ncbi:MAG: hypothetical protein HUK24_05670, partial [Sphaerochaetaceae bacterium]|nr:hypothetical protein [Sphaerochaetaceae bacterium]